MTTRAPLHDLFRRVARATANAIGSPYAFVLAVFVIALWAATGPMFHYSDTWQLVINTGTTIITFLVVFAIQNTQNRDSKALHLKLDELLRAIEPARTGLCDLEDMPDEAINRLDAEFRNLRSDPDATEPLASASGASK
jgi:low affinity Fe/Cu permease